MINTAFNTYVNGNISECINDLAHALLYSNIVYVHEQLDLIKEFETIEGRFNLIREKVTVKHMQLKLDQNNKRGEFTRENQNKLATNLNVADVLNKRK